MGETILGEELTDVSTGQGNFEDLQDDERGWAVETRKLLINEETRERGGNQIMQTTMNPC